MIRFHLAENVHHGVARGLRLRSCSRTSSAPKRCASTSSICESANRGRGGPGGSMCGTAYLLAVVHFLQARRATRVRCRADDFLPLALLRFAFSFRAAKMAHTDRSVGTRALLR